MLIPISVIMLIDGAILLAWQSTSPLVWTRTVTVWDAKLLTPVESFGQCTPRDPAISAWLFFVPILLLHLLVLVAGNALAYRARDVPTSFHEGRWIMISVRLRAKRECVCMCVGGGGRVEECGVCGGYNMVTRV